MSALTQRKAEIVQRLVQTAPDKAVDMLERALCETVGDNPLVSVRLLVEAEVADRRLRNLVLHPIAPLCTDGAPAASLSFPSRTLAGLWRALKSTEAAACAQARHQFDADAPAHDLTQTMNALLAAAAMGLRQRIDPNFQSLAAICDGAQGDGAVKLAGCLEIGAVVRRAVQRLPEWITHPGGDTAAAARIAHRDAVEIAEDAGPRFFHMLAGHLAHRWMVLRVISAVMDKPTERYMADSELADFGEAVLNDVDVALDAAAKMDPFGGSSAAAVAARQIESAVQQIVEVENCIDLTREQGWGKRIVKQRAAMTGAVEARLREAEKALPEALPTLDARDARSPRARPAPCLTCRPEPRALARAETLLAFAEAVRTSMNAGGFSSARTQTLERLSERLGQYADDALELLRTESAADPEAADAVLAAIASLTAYVTGEKAAELVRRRAAVAIQPAGRVSSAA